MKYNFAIIAATAIAAIACGCAAIKPLINPALGVAACATAQQYPQATPFIAAAGDLFTQAGRDTPPTPTQLATLLANIPGSDINALYATAIWQGAVVAYDALYSTATTPEAKAKLQATLAGIGTALTAAAVSCGPPAPTSARAVAPRNAPADAVNQLADNILRQFKRK